MVDRVRRPANFEEMMTELTKEKGVFKSYKDLLVFAACLGYKRNKRVEFSKSSEPINLQIFSGRFDQAVINSLAVAVTKDANVMGDEQDGQRIVIFEEYACGGLEILMDEFGESSIKSWEDALLTMVMQEDVDNNLLTDITSLAN